VFVGLGLYNEKSISLQGLKEVKKADEVFIELYTSLMPGFSIERFENLCGKKLRLISRRELEEENGQTILEAATEGKAVLLVPGDPLIATTHIALRIQAEKMGIKTRVVHGVSIISAAVGLSGLHNYKFGRTVTISFPQDDNIPKTPYKVIKQNKQVGLHTLCLLDIQVEKSRFMTIKEAIEILKKLEEKIGNGVITSRTLVVGIARAGAANLEVKAGTITQLENYDFGKPPHTLIFPAKLHFMEAEALKILAKAPKEILEEITE
jgi:diphthine synthase